MTRELFDQEHFPNEERSRDVCALNHHLFHLETDSNEEVGDLLRCQVCG